MEPVSFARVQIQDGFWKPRPDQVSRVTIPVCIDQTEVKTPRIRNFEKAARRQGEKRLFVCRCLPLLASVVARTGIEPVFYP